MNALRWIRRNGRHFFWREPGLTRFEVLVTEVLLARTRADAVEPVAQNLLREYPDAPALANAQIESVERILYPLGLYRKRAKALVGLAGTLVERHGGRVPRDLESLLSLPYVGRYAANAILGVAFGARRPVVDANVARLFERYFGLRPAVGKLEHAEEYWDLATSLLPSKNVRLYNWSLLDLGALVCIPRSPRCEVCPLRKDCHFYNIGPYSAEPARLGRVIEAAKP